MAADLIEAPDALIQRVIGHAIVVHSHLRPGLLESVYERALLAELRSAGITAESQVPVQAVYKGQDLGLGFRADIIVDGQLLLELKTVEEILPLHVAQVITYSKLLRLKRAILFNFNTKLLKDGIKRISI